VYILNEFEYNPGDALTFARRALAAVEAFVNGMFDAFEDGKREIETNPSRSSRPNLTQSDPDTN
jgi:hypothetical protein